MDRVRFGRALGMGARLAARTAVEAAQAAAAPTPASKRTQVGSPQIGSMPQAAPAPREPQILRPGEPDVAVKSARQSSTSNLGPAVKAAGAGMLGPLRGASRALWHEFTGSFFALFALSFSLGVWKTRTDAVSPIPGDRHHFYAFCALALLFGYFSVSSFLRARRKATA